MDLTATENVGWDLVGLFEGFLLVFFVCVGVGVAGIALNNSVKGTVTEKCNCLFWGASMFNILLR